LAHREAARDLRWGCRALAVLAIIGLAAAFCGTAAAQDAKTIAAAICANCHGPDGNSPVNLFPKIAGLQEAYIVKQLRDYQAGRRKSDLMTPIVAALKAEDFVPLAAHFSRLPRVTGETEDKKSAALGKLLYFDGNEETGVPACVGCHQNRGAGHLLYVRIGGQHAPYVKQQLKNFASGERSNDVNRFMRVIAKRLSEEEVDAIAAYLVGLEGQ
jgi:cytochrome c553